MEQFFQVPNKVFNLPLSLAETLVLIYLIRCSSSGDAFPSLTNIALMCKVDRHTAIRCIKTLEGKYITVIRSKQSVNHYRILDRGVVTFQH